MSDEYPVLTLNHVERRRVIRDIASWFDESEDKDCLTDYTQSLTKLSDQALMDEWFATVGEWAPTKENVSIPKTVDLDGWLDYQFGLLIEGKETEYGFLNVISVDHITDSSTANSSA